MIAIDTANCKLSFYKQIILEDNVVLIVMALGVPPCTCLAWFAERLTILSVLSASFVFGFFMALQRLLFFSLLTCVVPISGFLA